MEKADSRDWSQAATSGKLNHQTCILLYISKCYLSPARLLIFNSSIATKISILSPVTTIKEMLKPEEHFFKEGVNWLTDFNRAK